MTEPDRALVGQRIRKAGGFRREMFPGVNKLGAAGRLDLSILGKRKTKVQNAPVRFVALGARENPLHSLTHLPIRS